MLVKMVKAVRARAADPHASEGTRREARAVLAQHGFDDASLMQEDTESRAKPPHKAGRPGEPLVITDPQAALDKLLKKGS